MVDMVEIGRAFMRLGIALRDDKDTGLDEETLAKFIEMAALIPEPRKSSPPKWSEEKDPLGALILRWLKDGEPMPSGASNQNIRNALTRLRRNGLIVNRGSKVNPFWCLTTDDEREQVIEELRVRREQYLPTIQNRSKSWVKK